MNIFRINKIIIMICCTVLIQVSHAKVKSIATCRDFELALSKSPMVIALFYDNQKNNKEISDKNKNIIRTYEDLSAYKPYDDADIIFLKINMARKDLAHCATLYKIKKVPTILFFNQGKPLMDEQGTNVEIKGFISRVDLQSLIDKHYGDHIKQYIAQKEDRRQRILASENESWKPYFYPRDMVVRGYAPEETLGNME